ncbi:hypothetical protein MTO96_018231 [Rhipicephalus appendiculatus]
MTWSEELEAGGGPEAYVLAAAIHHCHAKNGVPLILLCIHALNALMAGKAGRRCKDAATAEKNGNAASRFVEYSVAETLRHLAFAAASLAIRKVPQLACRKTRVN